MDDDDRTSNEGHDGFVHDEVDRFVDRLIDGSIPTGTEFSDLENALIEMAAYSAPEIEVGGSSVVEKMAEEIATSTLHHPGVDRRRYFARLVGVKAIVAVTTAVAFTGASAAAASGSLPQPIQKAFSAAVSNLGVSLPSAPVTTTTSTTAPATSARRNSSNQGDVSTTTGVTSFAAPATTTSSPITPEKTGSAKCPPLISVSLAAPRLSTSTILGSSNYSSTTSTTTTTQPTTTTTTQPTTTTTTQPTTSASTQTSTSVGSALTSTRVEGSE